MNEMWREPARKQQWLGVRRALRADITQYTIYHRTNTVPLMRLMPPDQLKILSVDINALNECVEHLAYVYARLEKLAEFPVILERLRANIDDPRWQRKITYQQAMTAHLLEDTEGARRELAKLGPVTPAEDDLDVIFLHIDINGTHIELDDKLAFYQRILDLTESRQVRFQYSAAKAIELSLAGADKSARATVSTALNEARQFEEERPFGPATEHWFCKLLEVAGIVTLDTALFREAADRLRRLAAIDDSWTASGKAHLYRCLGDVLRLAGEWQDGARAYQDGFALNGDPACRIFEASCILMQRKPEDALDLLGKIDFDGLELEERVDYAIGYAAVAIALRDIPRLDDAAAKLKSVSPQRQYFILQNANYQLAIERARASIAADKPVPKSSRLLDWISSASRWFMIQPNIAGIGINFNAMADDAIAARRRKSKPDDEDAD